MRSHRLAVLAVSAASLFAGAGAASAQTPLSSGFTYQGVLRFQDTLVSGPKDLQFRLYAAPTGGSPIGFTLEAPNLQVTRGNFAVQLDFGPGTFEGSERYLEVQVGSVSVLSPRLR